MAAALNCGKLNDNIDLWNDVKEATPAKPGNNKEVVWPGNNKDQGYAIHDGAAAQHSAFNLLLIPTLREKGIECPNLLDEGSAPNYFQYTLEAATKYIQAGPNWALGIESANNRSRNQLHIHVSRLTGGARQDIENQSQKIADKESDWQNHEIVVQGKHFRAWNAPDLNHNLFLVLDNQVVQPKKVAMGDETLLVTANTKGKGVIVLNGDQVSVTNPGADNIEFLLNKG